MYAHMYMQFLRGGREGTESFARVLHTAWQGLRLHGDVLRGVQE
jgi:hypothetical protein